MKVRDLLKKFPKKVSDIHSLCEHFQTECEKLTSKRYMRDRERNREIESQRQRETQRETGRERHRHRERQRKREGHT